MGMGMPMKLNIDLSKSNLPMIDIMLSDVRMTVLSQYNACSDECKELLSDFYKALGDWDILHNDCSSYFRGPISFYVLLTSTPVTFLVKTHFYDECKELEKKLMEIYGDRKHYLMAYYYAVADSIYEAHCAYHYRYDEFLDYAMKVYELRDTYLFEKDFPAFSIWPKIVDILVLKKRYEDAINICETAIEYNLEDSSNVGWEKRYNKLIKKRAVASIC